MSETLQQALDRVTLAEWSHMRDGGKCLISQGTRAAEDVARATTHRLVYDHHRDMASLHRRWEREIIAVAEVTPSDIARAVASWYNQGLSPATITKRLNCLSKLGVTVDGMRPKKARGLKWWMRPEDRDRLCVYLRGIAVTPSADQRYASLADFIEWTTYTGLRIEESLRLALKDVNLHHDGSFDNPLVGDVTVPGTKTANAQATLPLGTEAATILHRRSWPAVVLATRVFHDLDYNWMLEKWTTVCRPFLGVGPEHPTCTLKALRRSAAHYLHVTKGMPLDMVRDYLRHEDIETTIGYLRLTGGYNTEAMRRYL